MERRLSPSEIVGLLVVGFILLPAYYFISEPGLIKKMWVIVLYNPVFYIAIFLSVVFGFYKKLTNPKTFTWFELPIQIGVCIVGIFFSYSTFFYTTTNISDEEIWNGYVVMSEYLEEWTEEITWYECVEEDDKGNCTREEKRTREEYHPPEWYIHTSNNEKLSIANTVYRNYVRYFGNQSKEILFHADQISIGDGNRYYTTFKGKIKPIWTAKKHDFVNLLKGSNSIILRKGQTQNFLNFLLPYPEVHGGKYGNIEVDRILSAGVIVPADWSYSVDAKLDENLAFIGKQKQVNVLVYLVSTQDQSFLHALEEHWVYGKKNDVVVIIGTNSFPKVSWVSIMAWTDIEEFKIELRNKILDMSDISDSKAFVNSIISQITKKPENGGFLRKPMADYNYVISSIKLPIWASIFNILLIALLNYAVSWALINNEIQDHYIKDWR